MDMIYSSIGRYDWVDPTGSCRTPREAPYSHDDYYLWRTFMDGDTTVEAYYTDRMRSWNGDKYKAATEGKMRNWNSVPASPKEAQEVVTAFFGEEYECVGIAQSINHSSGYPLGIFFVRKRK